WSTDLFYRITGKGRAAEEAKRMEAAREEAEEWHREHTKPSRIAPKEVKKPEKPLIDERFDDAFKKLGLDRRVRPGRLSLRSELDAAHSSSQAELESQIAGLQGKPLELHSLMTALERVRGDDKEILISKIKQAIIDCAEKPKEAGKNSGTQG
ncbi:MAG: hypothetical protein M0Q94_16385, partial [Candidatus Cloacimonetes bacterium]|nr:hypothetical protein [Candidatus Cloacimonadota bacterium]